MWISAYIRRSMGNNRMNNQRTRGCMHNWDRYGLLRKGLRRWGSTGSWVCVFCTHFSNLINRINDIIWKRIWLRPSAKSVKSFHKNALMNGVMSLTHHLLAVHDQFCFCTQYTLYIYVYILNNDNILGLVSLMNGIFLGYLIFMYT